MLYLIEVVVGRAARAIRLVESFETYCIKGYDLGFHMRQHVASHCGVQTLHCISVSCVGLVIRMAHVLACMRARGLRVLRRCTERTSSSIVGTPSMSLWQNQPSLPASVVGARE